LYFGKFAVDLYDVLIFPGLWAETVFNRNPSGAKPETARKKLKSPKTNLQEATEKVAAG
jgi:hypothetical protein